MIEFHPVTKHIGAEVTGVDLRKPLAQEEVEILRAGLAETPGAVLPRPAHRRRAAPAVRAQLRHAEPSGLQEGRRQPDPRARPDRPERRGRGRMAQRQHLRVDPPMGSLLRCVQLPSVGGDTCWANTYLGLRGALARHAAAVRRARPPVHDITGSMKKAIAKGHPFDLAEVQAKWPPARAPGGPRAPRDRAQGAVRRTAASTTRLVGLTDRENETLLPLLIDHIRSPEYQLRLRWRPGTLAFWDNRPTQHYAVRRLHRAPPHAPGHDQRLPRARRRLIEPATGANRRWDLVTRNT